MRAMNETKAESDLPGLREQSHPDCFACARDNEHGLGLLFHAAHDGAVEASFPCQPIFAGYPGMLHGGIVCTLLDGAMTNCLFAHGLAAVTVDINVRFRHPVRVSRPAAVRAWLESDGTPIHRLAAEVRQDGHVVATATARFVEKRAMAWFGARMT
ncbi:MAG: PaaI family thioesterase [Patescibacteria group bacterium]|nr:PaaI family thioesterase [Patescibacteria group bacterium]